jgi:beta-glucosidase
VAHRLPPYKDPGNDPETRVADLVSRMTLEEKLSQLVYTSREIPRLDIPSYFWWNECLHGIARAGNASVFPQAIALAATFDPALIAKAAEAIADEGRAKYNMTKKHGGPRQFYGLTFFSPNVNILRDPRWGRGQETYGEDPVLAGRIGTAFVKGLQGNHKKYLKAAACAKHFAAHSGPEKLRHGFDAWVSEKDLAETYLPVFKELVEAGVAGIMGAYNRLNGVPCCANKRLLLDTARGLWNFRGYITTDGWAVRDFHLSHGLTKNSVESTALAVNNGCDLVIHGAYNDLLNAVKRGLLGTERVDEACFRLLLIRCRLGMFDPPALDPFRHIGPEVIGCEKHRKLAARAAEESIVLLKNRNNILPISPDMTRICVVGPNAAATNILLGNYFGLNTRLVSVLEGIAAKAGGHRSVTFFQGCLLDRENDNPENWVKGYVADADVVIAVMGLSPLLEGEYGEAIGSKEFGDREDIGLPENQVEFVTQICRMGKPVILLIAGGGPVAVTELHDLVDAVLYIWYPGQEGGNAVADILFGNAVPSGRLPFTVPRSLAQLPPFEEYSMRGRTYRYMKKQPLYPFGFGLSYTSFRYWALTLSKQAVRLGEKLTIEVTVSNQGSVQADEVVQLYLTRLSPFLNLPLYELKDFTRINLKPREEKRVSFTITPEMLEYVDNGGRRRAAPGRFEVIVGGVSPGNRHKRLGAASVVRQKFRVVDRDDADE